MDMKQFVCDCLGGEYHPLVVKRTTEDKKMLVRVGLTKKFRGLSGGSLVGSFEVNGDLKVEEIFAQILQVCQTAFPCFRLDQVPDSVGPGSKLVFLSDKGNNRVEFSGEDAWVVAREAVGFFMVLNMFYLAKSAYLMADQKNWVEHRAHVPQDVRHSWQATLTLLVGFLGELQIPQMIKGATREKVLFFARLFH